MIKKFTKMQGLGNDFVLLDCRETPFDLDIKELQFLADRKFGIGCDQILIIEPAKDDNSDFNYRIFNADGSEAGNCGNGARCVIQYLWDKVGKHEIRLGIQKQIITGHKNPDDTISLNMGTPKFNPEELPFDYQENANNIYTLVFDDIPVQFGICSVGNPHVMIKLTDEAKLDNVAKLTNIAKLLQNSKLFPESVNVNFYVICDQSRIKLLTYERGCGFTLACGTGATATACNAILHNETNQSVNVEMPGGILNITWDGINEIVMSGPAVYVFDGQLCD